MERKLASVQTIKTLEPIEGADFIEKATIMGWSCVVKKGDFKVGDKCIYIEVDSMLPKEAEWAAFMKPRGFRVKTIKLRKQLSQGLAMPLGILVESEGYVGCVDDDLQVLDVGLDVTEALGIKKFSPPLPHGKVAGHWPSDIPKTDEIRLQSCVDVLEELKSTPFVATIKLDGTSGTFYKKDGELSVCSRNWRLKEGDDCYHTVARKHDLANVLPEGMCIQGEICGPGIQKNRLELDEVSLFVFNVFDVEAHRFFNYDEMVLFCHQHKLMTVPYAFDISPDELGSFEFTVENFLKLATGLYEGTKNRREGIVVRPLIEQQSDALDGSRFSFKCINNEFLLKEED